MKNKKSYLVAIITSAVGLFASGCASQSRMLDAFLSGTNITHIISGDTATPQNSLDQIDYSSITWFGAPRPRSATIADGVQIGNLSVSGNKLSYSWIKGGCENFGAPSPSEAGFTQCFLAIKVNGAWKGGKFDWISTSRTSRGLEHCGEGYNGWPIGEFNAATEFAFVIIGVNYEKDAPTGKRTNIIYAKRK